MAVLRMTRDASKRRNQSELRKLLRTMRCSAVTVSAAAAAALYAFHCFDDSPLFVVTWYALAALPVIALGAAVGHRLLRW